MSEERIQLKTKHGRDLDGYLFSDLQHAWEWLHQKFVTDEDYSLRIVLVEKGTCKCREERVIEVLRELTVSQWIKEQEGIRMLTKTISLQEYLLACLSEECSEIIKDKEKAIRFGLEDKVTLDPEGPRGTEGPTNQERIELELNDLMGVIALCVDHGVLRPDWADKARQEAKKEKVMKYAGYSRKVGRLEP